VAAARAELASAPLVEEDLGDEVDDDDAIDEDDDGDEAGGEE
jgi:hypothetical protein